MKDPILGCTVRDLITGFTGIVIQRRDMLNGNVQYAVQPKNKDGENNLPDAHFFDFHMIEEVDKGVSDKVMEPTHPGFVLGIKVRDKATGLEGTLINRGTFLNGCVFYDVMPEKKGTLLDGSPALEFIDATRLEEVKAKSKPIVPPVSDDEPVQGSTKRTGGPTSKVQRAKVMRV